MNFDKVSLTETNVQSPTTSIFLPYKTKKIRQNTIQLNFDILSNMDREKFIDSTINKFYTKYLQKQAFIQHEQKIYEIIEKTDEPKIFNSLRANYLREMNELKNNNNIINDKRKVTDGISSVNLYNFKKKLYNIYKLSGDDLGFMTSFMNHLGNRPKKIYKPKVNKKLEALSMGKLASFMRKKDKNKKENNYINNKNKNNNKNHLIFLLKDFENNNLNNNINNINNIEVKYNTENVDDRKEIIDDYNYEKDSNKNFFKKKTMNVHSQNIKLFRNSDINNANYTNYNTSKGVNSIKKYSVNYNDIYTKYKARSKEESLNDYSKEENKEKNQEIKDYVNDKRQLSKFNNNAITTNDTINTMSNFRDTIINKIKIQSNKSLEKKGKKTVIKTEFIDDNSSSDNDKKIEKNKTNSLISSKKINHNEEKNKILKMYKTSMDEFLQMVKLEGNIMNKTSTKLSSLLHKLKNENFETFQNERNKNLSLNQKNYKTVYNQNYNQENLNDKKFGKRKMEKTFYKSVGKSRFSIPYINKVVYGENNLYDPFEKLQKDLLYEVKNQIKIAELANKKKKKKVNTVIGIDILSKLIRENSEDELKKELYEMNNKIDNNQNKNNSPSNKNKNKNNGKNNEANKRSNKKNN